MRQAREERALWGAGSGGAQHGAAMRTARLSLVGLLLQGRGAPLLLSGRAEIDLHALLVPLVSHGDYAAAVGMRSLRLLVRLVHADVSAGTQRN